MHVIILLKKEQSLVVLLIQVLSRLFQLTDFKDLSLALSNCGFSYSLGSGSELGKPTYPAAGQVLDIDRHSQTDRHLMQSGLLN